jgi:hypothetical protein
MSTTRPSRRPLRFNFLVFCTHPQRMTFRYPEAPPGWLGQTASAAPWGVTRSGAGGSVP